MEEKPKVKIKRGEPRATQNWWPYALIAIGVFFLLGNLGIIAGLLRLWPLLLIGVGLMILSGRTGTVTAKHGHYSAPLDNTTSARVKLNLSVGEASVKPVTTPDTLIDADLTYVGDVDFQVSGEQEKMVSLSQTHAFTLDWLNPANWWSSGRTPLRWDIALSPAIPLDLDIHGGVGAARLDLGSMKVTGIDVNGGVGEIDLTLPDTGDYKGYMNIGVGSFKITVPSGASADLQIKGGVGECVINVPADAAVRVNGRIGVGELHMSSRLTKVSGDDGEFMSKRGVWETPGFDSAEHKIAIDYNGGVGQLRVR